jgi:hypothetical protein
MYNKIKVSLFMLLFIFSGFSCTRSGTKQRKTIRELKVRQLEIKPSIIIKYPTNLNKNLITESEFLNVLYKKKHIQKIITPPYEKYINEIKISPIILT